MSFPKYDDLPPVKGMPKGCAWGVFDKDGKKDIYGCLNKITPEIVKSAASEVKEGISVSLNWPIGAIHTPGFGRKGLVHNVIDFADTPLKIHGFDDEIEFNTQCSSQWDSLCHYLHQASKHGYNGAQPSVKDLVQTFGNEDKDKSLPTLNHWHDRGGLVGRGILLDYKAHAARNGTTYSPFEHHKITVADMEAMAAAQGTAIRSGDILIVRSGFTEALAGASAEEQDKMLGTHQAVGVEGSEAVARWVWDKGFAAVAGDTIAFEVLPPAKDGVDAAGDMAGLVLHQYFLSLFGLNIGELWDLKALSETCQRLGRYEFLLTSIPLNVPGGIGSPPNALAVF